MQLAGNTLIATGGASGLAEGTVRRFVKHGANAIILDLDENRAERIVDELGSQARFCKANIESEDDVQRAVDMAVDVFGGVHFLVNCAGTTGVARAAPSTGRDRILWKIFRLRSTATWSAPSIASGWRPGRWATTNPTKTASAA